MSSRLIQIIGYCVIFGLATTTVVASLVFRHSVATFNEALRAVMSRRLLLRVLIVLAWAWLGWHFLARTT